MLPERDSLFGSLAMKASHAEDAPGSSIGSYKLVEQIGEGGMGTVWLAEQIHPVRRQVALKVIKPGMDSRQVIARFEAERQALSLMDHPNIAKVLDAGTSSDQRPFFVMELVKGQPITQYCDERQLAIHDRLELFLSVCHAIQHAHQKGIIHRDIKPSNVLIAEYDHHPVAKVIDFGVAKALSQPLTESTMVTGLGQIVGTLEYMSPEQARINQIDIDTRSDIYSLGVLLYELLTGSTPFDRERVRSTAFDEMLRIIREEEPLRPSRKLISGEMLPQVAAFRLTEPAKLTSLLRGELDWIVMKALEKDRNRRYETANGLAMDIRRYLDGEVVQACPPSTSYRIRKFLQRNRTVAIAALLVLLSLIGGITAATIGMVQTQRSHRAERLARENETFQRQIAEARREEAESERQLAEQAIEAERRATQAEQLAREEEAQQRAFAEAITDFVEKDFLALTSVEGQLRFDEAGLTRLSKDTTLRELLDRAAAKLDTRTELAPQAEARLRWMIGDNYRGMGEYQLAIPHLERSATLYVEIFGVHHETSLDAMNSLAVSYDAAGYRSKAVSSYEQVLTQMTETLGADHPGTLNVMNNLAVCYHNAGQLSKALALYKRTFERSTEILGPDDFQTVNSASNLAACFRAIGDFDQALALHGYAMERMVKILGQDHPHTLASMNNLGESYRETSQLDKAVPLLKHTLERRLAVLGANHPDTLASMNNLALGYREAGRSDQALPLLEKTFERATEFMGQDHPQTLQIMNNLATEYGGLAGDLEKTLLLMKDVLERRIKILGSEHPDTLQSMSNLAWGHQLDGNLEESASLFEEAFRLQEINLGRSHPSTIRTIANLSCVYRKMEKFDEAISLLEAVIHHIPGNLSLHWVRRELRTNYLEAGRCREFSAMVDEEIEWANKELSPSSLELAGIQANLGSDLLIAEDYQKAEQLLRECLAIRRSKIPKDWSMFNAQSLLGQALLGQARSLLEADKVVNRKVAEQMLAEAQSLLASGYEGMKQQSESMSPQRKVRLVEAVDRLIELYKILDQEDETEKWRIIRQQYTSAE